MECDQVIRVCVSYKAIIYSFEKGDELCTHCRTALVKDRNKTGTFYKCVCLRLTSRGMDPVLVIKTIISNLCHTTRFSNTM